MATLSEHDRAVLNCVFNPSLPLDEAYNEELSPELVDIEDDTAETRQTNLLELEAIRNAETGNLEAALQTLERALSIAPKRASLYNNRAQVYQLLKRTEDAFTDLSKALEYVTDGKHTRTECQVLCQRGLLWRKEGKTEEARGDFERAARLGSQFARNQLVELNPYAALCNQMLRQVVDALK